MRGVEAERQPHVGVVEEDRSEEDRLPQPKGLGIDADENHLGRAYRDRQRQLAEMKTQRSQGVEVAVDVMNEMESPEKRYAMVRPMPPPERVVEQKDRGQRFEPARPLDELEETDSATHDPVGNRLQEWRLQERHEGQ